MQSFSYNGERIQFAKSAQNTLGRGGFATVYRGFFDGKNAAIKRIIIEMQGISN